MIITNCGRRRHLLALIGLMACVLVLFLLTSGSRNDTSADDDWQADADDKKNVFFIESSGGNTLNARQACAVESASRHHENLNITVYVTSAEGLSSNDSYTGIVKSLANVGIERVDVESAVEGSPLQEWIARDYWRYSYFMTEQLSDIIRYVLLWRHGGIYLDLDVIVIRDMANLTNCAAMDDGDQVTNAVLVYSKRNRIISECMKMIPTAWTGQVFAELGSNLITKVYKKVCRVDDLSKVNRNRCRGSTLVPSKSFYIVPWKDWSYLFHRYWTDSLLDEMMKQKSYLVHFYNKISKDRIVKFNSWSFIEILAKKHCPLVYNEAIRRRKF
ncbi:Uncharacterised protein g10695 [Pycnogonum litorale]